VLITSLTTPTTGLLAFGLDLRRDSIRALAYPGGDKAAEFAFRMRRGTLEATLEGLVLETMTGLPAITAHAVFEEAAAQGIETVVLTPDDRSALDALMLTKDVKARIAQTLDAGYRVVVPERFVTLTVADSEPRVAWWRVSPETGKVVGVLDSGLHQSMTFFESVILNMYQAQLGSAICADCSTAPIDILVGADSILVKYAGEVLKALEVNNPLKPWEQIHSEACAATETNIHETAVQIAMGVGKPDAVALFAIGAYMAIALVCP